MRVLIITSGILPVPAVRGGAIETRVNYLVDENEKAGLWDLMILSVYDADAEKKSLGFRNTQFCYLKISSYSQKVSAYWNRLVKKLVKDPERAADLMYHPFLHQVLGFLKRTNQIDAIILENRPDWVLKLHKKTNVPIFLHLGNDHLNADTKNASRIVESAEGILTVSDYISECVKTIPNAKSDRIWKIQQGIDQSLFDLSRYSEEDKKRIRRDFHLQEEDFVYYFAGRIEREKGVLELVRAFRQLKEENMRLVIVGGVSVWNSDNSYYKSVMEEVEKDKKRIILTGSVSHEKIAELQAVADVAVLPSTWNEPSGNAMIECMVAGLPLITTNIGGIPEYCLPDCSVLLDVTDDLEQKLCEAMHRLYLDPLQRKEMRIAAKEVGKRYTTREHYMQIHEVLTKVCGNGGRNE